MPIKKITFYVSIAALFLIPLFPLIVANSYFFPFITGKAFYFRILVEIAFMSWIILAAIDPKYRPKFTPLMAAISLFAVVTLIADLLGMNPLRSIWSNFERMEGWLTVAHLWMFFITATSIFGANEEGKRWWHRWLTMSFSVAVIIAIYGIGQLLGIFTVHQSASRIDASLGNAAYMAVYMLIHTFIALYLFYVARAGKIGNASFLRWAYPIAAAVFGYIVFMTQTRGTTLGLIGGLLLTLAVYAIFGKGEKQKHRAIAGGLIGLIVLVGIVFWLSRDASFIKKNEVLSRLASISLSDSKTQARGYVWPMALTGAAQRPIFGWGQENFNYIFNANYNPLMHDHEQWFDRAHNVFLDWLTASGFVGLLAYLALYVLFITTVWKSSLTIAEKSVLIGLLAAYAVHNIFVFDNLASYFLFFAMLGFASSLREGTHLPWLGETAAKKDLVEYVITPLSIVILVLGIYLLNVRSMQANTKLIAALSGCNSQPNAELFQDALNVNSQIANQEIREQVLGCASQVIRAQQAPGQLKKAFYDTSVAAIQSQIDFAPKDARMYMIGGSFLNNIEDFEHSLPFLQKAHELSPAKQTISFQLATALINNGKNDEAFDILKKTYDSDPTYGEAKATYAIALVVTGKEAQAKALYPADTDFFQSERMAQVYASQKQYTKAIAIYKKILLANPGNMDYAVRLAQLQYSAGLIQDAIKTLREDLIKNHPELKAQVEEAIKQLEADAAK